MRISCLSRNTLDEYRFSSSERSAKSTRATGFAQAMKSLDPLLEAWDQTLARKGDAPAIYATSGESMARAKEIIGGMTREIEIGQTYQGRVVSTKEFGAFVEVFPGRDGLVHISELADFRVKRTEDVAKVGDIIWVKCIGIDDKGRVKLSRKAALKERAEKETGQVA